METTGGVILDSAVTNISNGVTNWLGVLWTGVTGSLDKITGNATLAMFAIGVPVVMAGLGILGGIIGKRLKKGRR